MGMTSNFLTTSSTENLKATHPLRRMLRPHTYGAIEINMGAVKTLAVKGGTAHRATALSWKGLQDALTVSYQIFRYTSVPDHLQAMSATVNQDKLGNFSSELFPYGRDGREFYDIVANMVGSYVDVFYESDDDVLQDTELPAFWAGLHIAEVNSRFPQLTGKTILVEVLSTFI